jgi:hypothetical protein
MSAKPQTSVFRFQSTDTIGAAGAEDDREFLSECFVDTGLLGLLKEMNDNRLIVLGRTGAGKSALLGTLEASEPEHVIRVSPEQLALNYVANSTVLNFFAELGVNLDPFFKLLWRHVLTVEILARHFADKPDPHEPSFLKRLKMQFLGTSKRDKDMLQALDYLEKWGESFWQDTEYRVKEITSRLESMLDGELRATLGSRAIGIGAATKTSDLISDTERTELISRGQNIISKAQVQDLSKVLSLLDSVLSDRLNGYYLVIDGLDENWVEERLRYKLIMALMQTARDFSSVRYAKVIIALRRDLIERVFRLARDSGFQEEKYQSLYLPLVWTRDEILEVLDKRVNRLVSRRYTKAVVTHRDLLPRDFRHKAIGEYIHRIAPRPRDVIALFNACIAAAPNQSRLGAKEFRLAEGEYSRGRLRALADEWSVDYPTLADFATVLQRRPPSFKLSSVSQLDLETLCLTVVSEAPGRLGLLGSAMQVVDGVMTTTAFKPLLFRAFYQVGLVGLKLARHESESWVDEVGRSVSFAEIDDNTSAVVHPAFRRTLGVDES